ncbi:rRNA small subunit methyltransferase I [Furfurilactobacillus rossiae]|uniref:16S rRNA (cytidine(1402)-2'-O)-methyltransferase n=1 Tax=Furfurilactobacillus rossiae TaxID=231049 RepID=UPI0015C14557|nr:16S rRNA (cytidine(1402)-2'-O)-methyltransferase [Furfurilactobacillus rossiae]MCF6164497.1 16S rRNA (cytidine(1402)-2'-O)-methyltransferase [Furfurilactobacillus rossiae]QLE64781.1 rRNA small subunit methyltransferase I [Furfurilactobacillus rossiae]
MVATSQRSFAPHESGTLFLVPTPIGNLQDMTYRAVATLKQVDLIAAEDTRNTQKLLNNFDIETKQISFHEHNTQERIPELLDKLRAGVNIAQVSDAGMPSISDPGTELVAAAVAAQLPVVPLPGANAGLTALIASGLVPQPFYFYGFLDRKTKEQKTELAELAKHPETVIVYEAPHRLVKTVTAIANAVGPDRQLVLCRELTKKFEEFIRGTASEVLDWLATNPPRGEFVILIGGNTNPPVEEQDPLLSQPVEEHVKTLIARGEKPNDAIKAVAKARQLRKQEVYATYHHLNEDN